MVVSLVVGMVVLTAVIPVLVRLIVRRLCVIDREAGGRENLSAEGLDLRALFTMGQLRAGRVTDSARS